VPADAFASRRVSVGGCSFHYLDFPGSGPPLVFLHATGFHAWLWLPYARRLAPARRVLCLDQRGHGETDKPSMGYRWDELGHDVAAFLDALDLRGVVAVGHSMGGTCIAAAAAAGTRRLAGAVLLDPVLVPGAPLAGPAWDGALAAGARRRRDVWPSREEMFRSLRGKPTFAAWEEEFVRLYVDHGVADRPDGQVELRCPREIESTVFANAVLLDGLGCLARLRVPTLLVRGVESPTLPPALAGEALRRLPDGRLLSVAGAGHFVPQERSAAVMDVLAGAAGQLPRPGRNW
jgi:pimeloyl-ACP methyl ester carboxylesterase